MTSAYLNRVATAVPPNDVHAAFLHFARAQLKEDRRGSLLFRRMAEKGGIDHRYSYLVPANDLDGDVLDADALFVRGRFPNTPHACASSKSTRRRSPPRRSSAC